MIKSTASRQPISYYLRRAVDSILAAPVVATVTIASIAVSVLLAGALLLVGSNVYRTIQAWGATGVDVSSGVETAPGKKDIELIRTFIAAARAAASSPAEVSP